MSTFAGEAAELIKVFRHLTVHGQPVSELEMMRYLEKATSAIASITHTIGLYKQKYPDLIDRSFISMVEFVQTHTQHATVATAGYAALVTNPKERKFTAGELEQAVEEGIQAYLSKIGRAG